LLASCWALPGRLASKPNRNRSGKLPEKNPLHSLEAAPVTDEGLTEWRTLRPSRRYGLAPELASLVRGSSRRITIVRFRPADIRVINRRTRSSLSPVPLPLTGSRKRCYQHFRSHLLSGFS
jgi:hypothetical protein